MELANTLARRRELAREITRLKGLSPLPNWNHRLSLEVSQERTRMQSLRTLYGNDMEKWPSHAHTDYNRSKENADRITAALDKATSEEEARQGELQKVQAELESCEGIVTEQELQALLDVLEGKEMDLKKLEAAMARKSGEAAAAGGVETSELAKLQEEMEDLQAQEACGEEIDQERLALVSGEIARVEALLDGQVDAMVSATKAVAGLERKIKQAKEECALARKNYAEALVLYLKQELEAAGGEYAEAGRALAERFMRVVAIASLLEMCGEQVNVFGPYTARFSVPSFLLDANTRLERPGLPGVLFDFQRAQVQAALETETARLAGLGVTLSA